MASKYPCVALFAIAAMIYTDHYTVHEKRRFNPTQTTGQNKAPLEFPLFYEHILMQKAWDARDPHGRIKILLSEHLVSNAPNPRRADFKASNELICFSFQHAPKGVYIGLKLDCVHC